MSETRAHIRGRDGHNNVVAMACGANVLEIADGMSAAPLPFVA